MKKKILAIAAMASLGSGYLVNPSVCLSSRATDKRSYIAKSKGKQSKKDRRR